MKAIWFYYIGLGIDIIALLIAVGMMVQDALRGYSGTNNPAMFGVTLLLGLLIAGAVLLKNAGKLALANTLLWIPGLPLAGYGLLVLLFVIFRPDMK